MRRVHCLPNVALTLHVNAARVERREHFRVGNKEAKGLEKAKLRVARVHRNVADRRKDFVHKLTAGLIHEARAVCIESLNVRGLERTELAKSIYDAARGRIRSQLTYKADWNGKPVAFIERFFPSSKTCHSCGVINDNLTLDDCHWTCDGCGELMDRDFNASLNIRDEGIRVMLAAGPPRAKTLVEACIKLPMGAAAV